MKLSFFHFSRYFDLFPQRPIGAQEPPMGVRPPGRTSAVFDNRTIFPKPLIGGYKPWRRAAWLAMAFLPLLSCHKDKGGPGNASGNNSIVQVAYNNFSLYLYYAALASTGYGDTLTGAGPYTVLAPSNAAFQAAGFNAGTDIIRGADSMRMMMPYLILKQRLAIDSTPLAFDQPFTTADGKQFFLTHWMNKRDTAVVVNGIRISTLSRPASNGLVNIADGLIYPSIFNDVQTAVSGNPDLTLFNAALMQSGVYKDLHSGGPYTLFAPANAAFMAIGIPSTDSIYKMDPARLKTLVLAHVAPVRAFVYDYILKADETTNTYSETMMDGSALKVRLLTDATKPGRFTGITLTTAGGTAARMKKTNVLADNGVVHSINTLLTTNF